MTSLTTRSASGCGSNPFTSTPASRKRPTHPPPMTPPPIQAALEMGASGFVGALVEFIRASSALHQLEPFADFLRTHDPGAHSGHDAGRFLDELRIGREFALADVEVVLKPDADIAASEHSCGRIGEGVAADRKGRER